MTDAEIGRAMRKIWEYNKSWESGKDLTMGVNDFTHRDSTGLTTKRTYFHTEMNVYSMEDALEKAVKYLEEKND